MSRGAVSALVLAINLAVSAAHAQESAPPAPEEAVMAPPATIPNAKLKGESTYLAAGGRDPFRPFTLDLRRVQGPLTPLQKYELGQLKVAGIVAGVTPPRAMVEDSIGMGYIVTIGTMLGPNGGVVTAIVPGQVVVEEKIFDLYGREQINKVVLTVPSDEAGEKTPDKGTREQR